MAIPAHTLGPGSLLLGDAPGSEFSVACTAVTLEPSVDTDDDLVVLSGDTLPGEDTFTWSLNATLLQSYSVGGLTDWLFDHRGEVVPFTFTPRTSHGRAWTGEVKVRPMSVGGDVKTRNTSDVEFPLVGEPVKAVNPDATDGE